MLIGSELARFAADLEEAFNEVCNRHAPHLEHYFPLGLELHSGDGVTARFMEDGIDFYPEAK